ncbi:MAG TPA: STAS domain-containing protein [Solirubrobacteraceae bacterium]|nr:STAS domain-containing protein [Solirubrobacteraceae bacterium]
MSPETSPTPLRLSEQLLDGGRCLLTVAGDVDLSSAPTLKLTLSRVLGDPGYRDVILDFSQLSFLDSTGLAVLIGFRRRLADGRRLVIAAASEHVLTLFEVTGLSSAFEIFVNTEDALHYLDETATAGLELPLSPDAALVLGLAGTALPFAASREEEAGCWSRIFLPHVGSTDPGGRAPAASAALEGSDDTQQARLDRVLSHAADIARQRCASAIRTGDVLRGVMSVYGAVFERAMQARHSENERPSSAAA